MIKANVWIVAVKNFKNVDKLVDYYMVFPDGERIYVFSKKYTDRTYNMCKGGIRINDLLTKRTQDSGVMSLVKRMKFMLPYLKEEYDVA